ncbi:MAG: hypothetical protein SGJ09_14165 [Phycisphaerae bacterium]|mgnify:CR=1 FL=1|nr:hypothetical protein [Phycisphaerae bacterium]
MASRGAYRDCKHSGIETDHGHEGCHENRAAHNLSHREFDQYRQSANRSEERKNASTATRRIRGIGRDNGRGRNEMNGKDDRDSAAQQHCYSDG